jgi:hypothetical protein
MLEDVQACIHRTSMYSPDSGLRWTGLDQLYVPAAFLVFPARIWETHESSISEQQNIRPLTATLPSIKIRPGRSMFTKYAKGTVAAARTKGRISREGTMDRPLSPDDPFRHDPRIAKLNRASNQISTSSIFNIQYLANWRAQYPKPLQLVYREQGRRPG